jgi:subtilisin family serine protease
MTPAGRVPSATSAVAPGQAEKAVNDLSASSGALFVMAAGNSGPSDTTVGSPGSAAAALTVAAVDRHDKIASFSSRGPTADGRLKPDIAAPGVDIIAAKAAHGTEGNDEASGYVSMSGTSMATPHTAGAAAVLAQEHPGWTGERLKAALRLKIRFRLTREQLASGHTLNIGITTAFANGRPRIRVNDWVSAVPEPAKEPTTRSLTAGSYRGNNHTYSYAVPASARIKSATAYQELTIDIVSGSGGTAYLSPGVSYDAIELVP